MRLVCSLALILSLLVGVQSVHLPLRARTSQVGNRARRSLLVREEEARLNRLSRVRRASLGGTVSVSDSNDFEYFVDVELGGHSVTVQIDTGSSDLWVATDDDDGFNITTQTAEIDYVSGSAEGPVTFGDLSIAGITVSQQAFIRVPPSSAFPSSKGLIGLGPSSGSVIFQTVANNDALPPLDRAFDSAGNASESFITVRLGRTADPAVKPTGDLTIGELLSGFENITSTPKLTVNKLPSKAAGDQHWQTLLDENGIIGPNGQPIVTPTNASANLSATANNQLSFIFDTGFTLPQVPSYISDAIYGNITGAAKQNIKSLGEVYVLPCNAEVNVTFVFGGQKIPIHPLDTNLAGFQDNGGNDICVGSFQPALPGVQSAFEDGNLGMAFLRNVYMLINFGDLVNGTTAAAGNPYIQLLPTTDPATAHQEFVAVRINSANSAHRASIGLALSVATALVWALAF
jgi:hypothetical protein